MKNTNFKTNMKMIHKTEDTLKINSTKKPTKEYFPDYKNSIHILKAT